VNCCILYRVGDGKLQFVYDEAGDMKEFSHLDDAVAYADANGLFQSGQASYQIVELDEL
jgi:hypothetical protein